MVVQQRDVLVMILQARRKGQNEMDSMGQSCLNRSKAVSNMTPSKLLRTIRKGSLRNIKGQEAQSRAVGGPGCAEHEETLASRELIARRGHCIVCSYS